MDGNLLLEIKSQAESELRSAVSNLRPEEAAVLAMLRGPAREGSGATGKIYRKCETLARRPSRKLQRRLKLTIENTYPGTIPSFRPRAKLAAVQRVTCRLTNNTPAHGNVFDLLEHTLSAGVWSAD